MSPPLAVASPARARLELAGAWVAPLLVLWLSLVLLRVEVVRHMRLDAGQALEAGLLSGLFADLSAALAAPALAAGAWAYRPRAGIWTWLVAALAVWFVTVSNALYFQFFDIRLDWWTVRLHWTDFGVVQGSAASIGMTVLVVLSTLVFVAACALHLLWARPRLRPPPAGAPWRRLLPFTACAVALIVCVQLPRLTGVHRQSTVVSDSVVRWWWRQIAGDRDLRAAHADWQDALGSKLDGALDLEEARKTLVAYRDRVPSRPVAAPPPPPLEPQPPPGEASWPLLRRLGTTPEHSAALRRALGLPADGALHVVMLFLESVRSYEVQSPELGHVIFPALNERLAHNAFYFPLAYSSALYAGQTVRAQFSTQCSFLPNIGGAAEYIAHTNLRTTCVQELLRDAGWHTVWINSHYADYHRKKSFEMLHGMEAFYDGRHFRSRGITQRIGDWGLADEPVLLESVRLMNDLAAAGKPLYVNLLTISTHHPHSIVPEGPLPQELLARYVDVPDYLGYLSRLRYLDLALASFFEALFTSPMADRTLVVLIGDHGMPVLPTATMAPPHIYTELKHRVPLALLTKNMPQARRFEHPVHQIDVVPTVARLAGVDAALPWVGRGLFQPHGSPWLFQIEGNVAFREGGTACYRTNTFELRCYDVSGVDPLFASELPALAPPAADVAFFTSVVYANLQLIALNAIAPRPVAQRAP